ncbi:cupin domain-containing protein [Lentisphaera profundi]|uniref:Cupin domain-containing protein n=1 Tax=Lentisphaera profundi TaxID=1658616 RepID=A0ABY7VZ88_9BACT|nr:cupin domain-containing protein [Lentisphaera profundi]WDE98034.1 cupin domain-containing protein [Lentisphaera profundi]
MNLFNDIPQDLPEELVTDLLKHKSLRIERIVSQGQSSVKDFWYDQGESEYLCVLQGEISLEYLDGSKVELAVADTLLIPAHCKHRVAYTSSEPKCICLAIFYKGVCDD